MLMNHNLVISGLMDSLVRAWDLRTFSTRQLILAHNAAMWLLYSPTTDFTSILSGDRNGNILQSNIEYATHGSSSIMSISGDSQSIFHYDYNGVYRGMLPKMKDMARFHYPRNQLDHHNDSFDISTLDLSFSARDPQSLMRSDY